MKRIGLALVACALAALSSPAWASNEIQGNITRLDTRTHVVAVDGDEYKVAPDVNLEHRVIGDMVAIEVEPQQQPGEKPLVTKLEKIG